VGPYVLSLVQVVVFRYLNLEGKMKTAKNKSDVLLMRSINKGISYCGREVGFTDLGKDLLASHMDLE
jgi:hypothetical protein